MKRKEEIESGTKYLPMLHRGSCHDGQRSVTIQTPPNELQHPESGRDEDDAQDYYWGDTTTAVTSERSASLEEFRVGSVGTQGTGPDSRAAVGMYMCCGLVLLALLTPLAFITLPQVLWGPELTECGAVCEGLYISVSFKLLLVILASWAVFIRCPHHALPRIVEFRALLLLLLFICITSYWLFYAVRVLGSRERNLLGVVQYAASLVDTLLFIHYLAVVLLELRQLHPLYSLKVVRCSDGEARYYSLGILSIQRAALFVLENYCKDFPVFNPSPSSTKKPVRAEPHVGVKVYTVDEPDDSTTSQSHALVSTACDYKEKYYEEAEHARKVRRRKARLVVAVEDAFSQLQSVREHNEDTKVSHSLDPREAAQSIFPLIAQSLQRYLRTTHQSHLHSMEGIVQHLTACLTSGMSAQAFLEQYLRPGPPLQYTVAPAGLWTLVSEESVTRPLRSGLAFCLQSTDTRLVVSVSEIPSLRLSETFIPPNSHRFTLRTRPDGNL